MFRTTKFLIIASIMSITGVRCQKNADPSTLSKTKKVYKNIQIHNGSSKVDNCNCKFQNYLDYWRQELKYIKKKKVDKKSEKLKSKYINELAKAIKENVKTILRNDEDPILSSIESTRKQFYKHLNKAPKRGSTLGLGMAKFFAKIVAKSNNLNCQDIKKIKSASSTSEIIAKAINSYQLSSLNSDEWIKNINIDKNLDTHYSFPEYTSIFQTAITADDQSMLCGIYVPKKNYNVNIKDRKAVILIHGNLANFSNHTEHLKIIVSFFDKNSDYICITRRGENRYKCSKKMLTENGLRSDADTTVYELLKRGYQLKNISVIGASLGGFHASYISSKFNIRMGFLVSTFSSITDCIEHLLKKHKGFVSKIKLWAFKKFYKSDLFYKYDNAKMIKNKISNTPILQLYSSYDEIVSPDSSCKIPAARPIILKDIKANMGTVKQTYNLTHLDMISSFFYFFIRECAKGNFEFDNCFKRLSRFCDNDIGRVYYIKKNGIPNQR